jgi:hypothetical protein
MTFQTIVNNAVFPPVVYGETTDTTVAASNTTIINNAISDLSANGGGVVGLLEGIVTITGDGTASNGAIRLQDNVTVEGQGVGVSVLKLIDQYSDAASAHKITGLVRTPSGVKTKNAGIKNLTIDGNRQKQTLAIDTITFSGTTATVTTSVAHGLATNDEVVIDGASEEEYNVIVPSSDDNNDGIVVTGDTTFTYVMDGTPASNAVAQLSYIARNHRGRQVITSITFSGTTATVTTSAAHNLADSDIVVIMGASDQLYNGDKEITVTGASTFTYSLASEPASNAVAGLTYTGTQDGFYCGVTPASAEKDDNIFVFNCEIKNMTHYGLDPHEQTLHFQANNNLFWNNVLDRDWETPQ